MTNYDSFENRAGHFERLHLIAAALMTRKNSLDVPSSFRQMAWAVFLIPWLSTHQSKHTNKKQINKKHLIVGT